MVSKRRNLSILGIVAVAISTLIAFLFNPFRSMSSVKKVGSFPIYSMTYYGNIYEHLRFVVPQSEEDIKKMSGFSPAGLLENQACTVFSATGGENMIYGRNRDLYDKNLALLLYTDPPGGYKSISVVDISQLGLKLEMGQDKVPWGQRILLLVAPIIPSEGINEYGVTIAKADSPSDDLRPYDPSKESLLFRTAMRVVLDHAKSTHEAIEILDQYNIAFGPTGGHFLIADPSGDSAIVEFFDNQMIVIRSPEPWLVMTNFNIGSLSENEEPVCERYIRTEDTLKGVQGQVSPQEAMDILEQASIPETLWSIVFNLSDISMDIALYRQYDEILQVSLADW